MIRVYVGDGYREVLPNEPLLEGDQYWSEILDRWVPSNNARLGYPRTPIVFYRRKIEKKPSVTTEAILGKIANTPLPVKQKPIAFREFPYQNMRHTISSILNYKIIVSTTSDANNWFVTYSDDPLTPIGARLKPHTDGWYRAITAADKPQASEKLRTTWYRLKGTAVIIAPHTITSQSMNGLTWETLFDKYEQPDGSPFGVVV